MVVLLLIGGFQIGLHVSASQVKVGKRSIRSSSNFIHKIEIILELNWNYTLRPYIIQKIYVSLFPVRSYNIFLRSLSTQVRSRYPFNHVTLISRCKNKKKFLSAGNLCVLRNARVVTLALLVGLSKCVLVYNPNELGCCRTSRSVDQFKIIDCIT